jgi:uncharacterized membrane protein
MTKLFKLKRRLSTSIETDLLMILWFSFLGAAIVFTLLLYGYYTFMGWV